MKQYNFSISEILNDATNVDVDNKKETAKKYGIDSNKIKEIAHQIYGIGLEIIKTHDQYDDSDMLVWNRYWDFPESSAKLRVALAGMTDEFIQSLINRSQKYIDSHSSRRYPWVEKKVRALQSILDARHESKDDTLKMMVESLTEQTAGFHEHYVKNLLHQAEVVYCKMEQYKNVKTESDLVYETPERRSYIMRMIRKFRVMSHDYDYGYYMDQQKRDAEDNFLSAMTLVAKRCEKAGLDADKIKVESISDTDAKAFDIYVTDGAKTMHARSIFVAQFSAIVTPHWRFIITNA